MSRRVTFCCNYAGQRGTLALLYLASGAHDARASGEGRDRITRWLYRAAGLPRNGELVMSFADSAGAKRAAAALQGFKRRGRLGPPGSFDETGRDPKGEGLGYFD